MFYMLYGKDEFRRHQALEKIKDGLGDGEMLAVNTSVLDGEQLSLSQLRDACSAYPSLLCPARLVVVEGLLGRFEPKPRQKRSADGAQAKRNSALEEWRGLGDYVKEMPPTTQLVLVDGDVNAGRNPLMKSLSPVAEVMSFSQLRDTELGGWVRERVKQGGGTISREGVNLLVMLVGGDLWTMGNEVDKLLAYTLGHITEGDVKQLTSYAREANVFALVDAILEGRPKVAQQLLHHMLEEGAAPPYLLSMIARQLGLIVRANELRQTLSPSRILDRLGVAKNFPIDRLLDQASAYTLARMKSAYHEVLEADVAIKTGKYDGDLALDLLVIDLCRR